MGERKVLNKYYPPDFDTIRLPKLPGGRPDQYVIRIMAPFTMRCLTCGNYVYKGRKFNSRKEDAKGENYLGLQIYRFYIRCPECLSEITFKTDPQNADYVPEHGAIRTFQAERLADLEEEKEAEEKEEEEANNPMLALENRTAESRMEMDVLDALEEIRDWNSRNASVKHEHLLEGLIAAENKETDKEDAALTAMASKIFEEKRSKLRRLDDEEAPPTKRVRPSTSGKMNKLLGLVVRKTAKKSGGEKRGDLKDERGEGAATSEENSCVAGSSEHDGSKDQGAAEKDGSDDANNKGPNIGESEGGKGTEGSGGLGLLCGYSDTSSDSD